MITAQIDTTGFNRGILGLIKTLRVEPRVVVEKETGELIKALVRLSPPKEPSKTRADIQSKINSRFEKLRDQETNFESDPTKEGSTGIKWYAASSKYLFGAARDSDMTKADSRTLLNVYYRAKSVQHSQRIVVPFKGRKTLQKVAIATRILTKQKQVNAIIKKVQGHVGRLKAGWLVAAWKGGVKITGGYLPPAWVARHKEGARGSFINQLSTPGNASFTITNFAKGVTNRSSAYWVSAAVKIRAKAMVANAKHFAEGKKPLSAYATGKTFTN